MQIFVRFFAFFWCWRKEKERYRVGIDSLITLQSRYNHAIITLFLQTKTLHSRYDKGGRKRTGKIKEKQEK